MAGVRASQKGVRDVYRSLHYFSNTSLPGGYDFGLKARYLKVRLEFEKALLDRFNHIPTETDKPCIRN
jgi:hypothetical protein